MTKLILTAAIATTITTVSANATWCTPCYDACVSSTGDHVGCALSEWLGGDYGIIYTNPSNKKFKDSFSKIIKSSKDYQSKSLKKRKNYKKGYIYKQTCSAKALLRSFEKNKNNPKEIIKECFKTIKMQKRMQKIEHKKAVATPMH